MKHEWKKAEKQVYIPSTEPVVAEIPEYKYFTLSGNGDPNSKEFAQKIEALYAMSYAVRMMPRNGFTPEGYFEYTVYPLEGVWSGDALDKNTFNYTIMIRQPDFVSQTVYEKALAIAQKKKQNPNIANVKLEGLKDGKSVQMMHVGAYHSEPESFAKMDTFLQANGLVRRTATHREIYLSDPSKGDAFKQKTVLRYVVK